MKDKNKSKKIYFILLALILIVGLIVLLFVNNKNENALTLEENKWIDANKYNVIDISVMNDIPVLSYDGQGIVYDFLDYVTENYSLKFNVVTYKLDGTSEYDYKMDIVDSPNKKDIVLLEDNLSLLTIKDYKYKDISDIKSLKIGILSSDKEKFEKVLSNVTYVEYQTYSELKNAMSESKSNIDYGDLEYEVDGIIVPKTLFIDSIIKNNYSISFKFDSISKFFVISTTDDSLLCNILHKYYNIWQSKEYLKKYNEELLDNYYTFNNMSDVDKKTLVSKKYVYGFIDYGIYNNLKSNKLSGLTEIILKDFNDFSGISISFTKYNSINRLLRDFENSKVDFTLNIYNPDLVKKEVYNTVGVFDKTLVVTSGVSKNIVINSFESLKGEKVLIIKNSYLEKMLTEKDIKFTSYNNMKDLTKDYNVNNVVIVDLENYNFYKTTVFKNNKIDYLLDGLENYNFSILDVEENGNFKDLFDFYLSFASIKRLINSNYESIAYRSSNLTYIYIMLIIILLIYVIFDFTNHFKLMLKKMNKNKKLHLSKADKIKYIDQLTSLKNRAYFNSKVEMWDDSEYYPKAIIVIDLNNIAYINDNYGREEGDKVITEAANILIMHQLSNSEIIRTDGNEFLIYLVGYTEKQIISYIRKLSKELKGLSHGFGAATGYSIILDAIKTIDDAVNEATIDMKNNKEDIDY